MRIRKRCPPPSPPPLTPSPPDLQSCMLQPLPSSESRPLHHRNDLSIDDNNSLTHRRDSPNLSLRPPKENEDRQRSDLEFVASTRSLLLGPIKGPIESETPPTPRLLPQSRSKLFDQTRTSSNSGVYFD
ncbi:hypothetical protein F0562_003792 [Nyssa sinensis]|uniref:Uncharacterized protein n=1 Tax=Nyssa sinensis TaxID=561372 RepID=A0A5J5BXI6_9ASTE|nr:hypothetical protein F0562_003792 [Nyssa sinensis]